MLTLREVDPPGSLVAGGAASGYARFVYNQDGGCTRPLAGSERTEDLEEGVVLSDDVVVAAGAPVAIPWWIPLVQGILTIVVGLLFLTNPAATSITFAFIIGVYWFVRGIIDLVLMFVDTTMWGWKLFIGVIGILAGWLVMSVVLDTPLLGTLGLASAYVWVLGIMGVVIGVADIVQAFQGAGWGRGLLGVLMIILGGWLIANPVESAIYLPWVFGVLMLVFGAFAIIAAFQLKKVA